MSQQTGNFTQSFKIVPGEGYELDWVLLAMPGVQLLFKHLLLNAAGDCLAQAEYKEYECYMKFLSSFEAMITPQPTEEESIIL